MVDTTFKAQCQELRRQGKSLNDICVILNRSKTTVYFHVRDIPLPDERQREVSAERAARMREYTARYHPKGVSRLGRHPIPFRLWTAQRVSAVAHFVFDGRITHGACMYYNRSAALLDGVQCAMCTIYSHPPRTSVDVNNVVTLEYNNVELAAYIKAKSIELLNNILSMNLEMQRTFLQAFFDDEGCISHEGRKRRVRGYQHDREMLRLIQKLLLGFGIVSTIDKAGVELIISRKHNIVRFRDEIGFSPGIYVNGARKNSVWKQSLEKRAILDRAIASYLPPGTPGVTRACT